jgi:hypothetical protein
MSSFLTYAVASVAILAFFAANAMPQSPRGYEFPDGSEDIISAPVAQEFTCVDRPYGYYADINNACEVFHICLPIEDNAGAIIDFAQWSFVCGNQTIFDQQTLTCNYPTDAFPCEEAESLYNAVEYGLKDDAAY